MKKELYRGKYTKKQFKGKIEDTYHHYTDYGMELELKEQDCEDNPYYYELTKPDCHIDGFEFKEQIVLSWEDEDYLAYEYGGGEFQIDSNEAYFVILANELEKFSKAKINKLQEEIQTQQAKIEELEKENRRLQASILQNNDYWYNVSSTNEQLEAKIENLLDSCKTCHTDKVKQLESRIMELNAKIEKYEQTFREITISDCHGSHLKAGEWIEKGGYTQEQWEKRSKCYHEKIAKQVLEGEKGESINCV